MVKSRSTKYEVQQVYKKGRWTTQEDNLLLEYVKVHGKGKWNRISCVTGLKRCGKSCRLRWMNYLSPNIKKGKFSQDEDDLIIRLHKLLGSRWSLIAGRVPGRTDNQVKNYWNTHLSKKIDTAEEKCKSIQNFLHPQCSEDNAIHSNLVPYVDLGERRPFEKRNCVADVVDMSFEEVTGKGEKSTTHHCQSSGVFYSEDDELIVNDQSLLDFLSEYSLDYVWNNAL